MVRNLLFVMIGGAIGSGLRYSVGICCSKWYFTSMPVGTLSVNLIGCLLLGLLMGITERYTSFSQTAYLMLAVGLCGAFTTFSTFTADACRLLNNGQWWLAIGYVCINLAGGYILFYFGKILLMR